MLDLVLKTAELQELKDKPAILICGLIGNILAPVAFILLVWTLISRWHNPDEAQKYFGWFSFNCPPCR